MEYPKRKCIKSVIITGLVLAVSFALGGCGEKSAADAETETAAIAATETEYTMPTEKEAAVAETEVKLAKDPESMNKKELTKLISQVEKQMRAAAADLNFEQAAQLRDKMIELKKSLAELEGN